LTLRDHGERNHTLIQCSADLLKNEGPIARTITPLESLPVVGVQPAYAVLDLRAAFEVNRHWRVALSVNNALDKRYYESIELLKGWYGEPRNWMLRIDGRY
jgi:outer membrane receptor protein involved in Fe transport